MKINDISHIEEHKVSSTFLLALRVILGMLYVSEFWKRFIQAPEIMDPTYSQYLGIEFNSFYPHAIGLKSFIEYFLTRPELLQSFLIIFTVITGLIGIALILGLFTRLMSMFMAIISFFILLGVGWMGSTCQDQWQIQAVGLAFSLALIMTGSGYFSLDNVLFGKRIFGEKHDALVWLTSGPLPVTTRCMKLMGLFTGIFMLILTIWTNQAMHGSVFGKEFSYVKKSFVEVVNVEMVNDQLNFELYTYGGATWYGPFIVELSIFNQTESLIWKYKFGDKNNPTKPSDFKIQNKFIAQMKLGEYSLEVPLGAKAMISHQDTIFKSLTPGNYTFMISDISGRSWKNQFSIDY